MAPTPNFRFDLSGGNLALDFANTVSSRPTENRKERLPEYRSLLAFGKQTGVLPARAVDCLQAKVSEAPGQGQGTLQEAIRLREALFEIFSAVAQRHAIPGNALALLNAVLQESASHGRIVRTSRRFAWEWIGMDGYLDSVVWPVARAAAELLTSDEDRQPARLRFRQVRLALPRQNKKPPPPLVRHENLRQPGEGATPLPARQSHLTTETPGHGEKHVRQLNP